jgi:F0F1-type ATP synthase assembly protein I
MSEDGSKNTKRIKNYLRYSALGFQMVGIILLGFWGGYQLDRILGLGFPILTILLSLLGIGAAMYFLFKETGNKG